MTTIGETERITQDRIVRLFRDELGYRYLGNWERRMQNSNVEQELLQDYLVQVAGYGTELAKRAIWMLVEETRMRDRSLYEANQEVHKLLRYGVDVQEHVGTRSKHVHFIDWERPERNHFAIAEEVTFVGVHDKRPDIVLYINGIAVGVLELKRSTVSVGEGIRQSIANQRSMFIGDFFATIQLVLAGNDSEGLRYGTIGTQEKFFLSWKEDVEDTRRLLLDKYLLKLCDKQRILELIHDYVLYDGGEKKLPRHHQYFGIKAAQEYVRRREGGIIWHTQGSGKSIAMVLLARWILENKSNARVVVLTDRTELDKQIEGVFVNAGVAVARSTSGQQLMQQLGQANPRLLCALIHKFGAREVDQFDKYIHELQTGPAQTVGELYVFVDECHRTQSGKLHRVMKAILRQAVFIGFTGTPLLNADKKTSLEVFGGYIHTYKFNEAVEDNVVLDLVYEARDIDQRLTNPKRIDEYFELTTQDLNEFQKSELKKKWGTMQKVLSSKNRIEKVVLDIQYDFKRKPRLSSGRGNAILVAGSIYEAAKYYERFQQTEFRGRCAVVTSYNPQVKDITTEDTGANTETEKEFLYKLYSEILKDVVAERGKSRTETYEDKVKAQFKKTPKEMRLLIVVDKLLTGFDAPSCSYLYIDKSMRDHGLFQAICRVNRLDSEDKQFGYIVDYKDLFRNLVNEEGTGAIQVYTSELDYDGFAPEDCDVLMQDRLRKGRERLDDALEQVEMICEPVVPPRGKLEYQRYFCGNPEVGTDLERTAVLRNALYKGIVALFRAFANVEEELEEAGYTAREVAHIRERVLFYERLREEIRLASGEHLDTKAYEADMRHLIDNYIMAEEPRPITPLGDMPLLELIQQTGLLNAIAQMPEGIKGDRSAVAEAIENNVRQKIIRDHLLDPAFYEEMSKLLDALILKRRQDAIAYEAYLQSLAELIGRMQSGGDASMPAEIRTPGQRAIYNFVGKDAALALRIHERVLAVRPDDWRDNDGPRERVVKAALFEFLQDMDEVERLIKVIIQQAEY